MQLSKLSLSLALLSISAFAAPTDVSLELFSPNPLHEVRDELALTGPRCTAVLAFIWRFAHNDAVFRHFTQTIEGAKLVCQRFNGDGTCDTIATTMHFILNLTIESIKVFHIGEKAAHTAARDIEDFVAHWSNIVRAEGSQMLVDSIERHPLTDEEHAHSEGGPRVVDRVLIRGIRHITSKRDDEKFDLAMLHFDNGHGQVQLSSSGDIWSETSLHKRNKGPGFKISYEKLASFQAPGLSKGNIEDMAWALTDSWSAESEENHPMADWIAALDEYGKDAACIRIQPELGTFYQTYEPCEICGP